MPRKHTHSALFNKGVLDHFLPMIAMDGWQKITATRFGRLEADVYQWIAISHDDRGSPQIIVEFGVNPLVVRSAFATMAVGGRFWRASHGWKSLRDESAVANTVASMCSEWSERVRPWMEDVKIPTSYRTAVRAKELRIKGHDAFDVACSYMGEGQLADSAMWFERAQAEYTDVYRQNPHAKWADEHEKLCQEALREIAAGSCANLCAEWKEFTYTSLSLEKYFGPFARVEK